MRSEVRKEYSTMSIMNAGAAPPTDEEMSEPMRHALDVLEQMCAQGLSAVPVKPSMEMLLAGAQAGGISIETAWNVWTAMLRAAD